MRRVLASGGWDRNLAERLVAVARSSGEPWELRRLAAWLLEHQVLVLDPRRAAERDRLLAWLGLRDGGDPRRDFALLRRRLARLARLHRPLAGPGTPAAALADFLDQARREAKLTLARHLFTPEETAERVLALCRVSRGRRIGAEMLRRVARLEARRALGRLSEWERRFLARLAAGRTVLWTGDETPEEVGSLVETPPGTVVLVVRPPGGGAEIEVKRAGRRGPRPLGVVFRRNGGPVPAGHRSDGASIASSLAWDAGASAFAAELFRRVHGREAPLPSVVGLRSIDSVPAAGGPAPLAAYLSDPQLFGAGYAEMRRAMEESVSAFGAEDGADPAGGERPLVDRYLAHVSPAQAVVVGTSACRLDRLDDYLRRDRPLDDFAPERRDAAGRRDRAAARRVADEVLDEVLGVYTAPAVPYRGHRQYLAAAFAVPANRVRADAAFSDALAEIGTFWGTLLAVRGYSWGESFVGRNVGLRSVFAGGRWRVRIVFMDHDNLHLAARRVRVFDPLAVHRAILVDERYVVGFPGTGSEKESDLARLERIYRAGEATAAAGRRRWRRSLRRAYRRTRRALAGDPAVRRMFYLSYLGQVADWERTAESWLRTVDRGGDPAAWRRRRAAWLTARGHGEASVARFLEAAETWEGFNRRFRFLTAPGGAP